MGRIHEFLGKIKNRPKPCKIFTKLNKFNYFLEMVYNFCSINPQTEL